MVCYKLGSLTSGQMFSTPAFIGSQWKANLELITQHNWSSRLPLTTQQNLQNPVHFKTGMWLKKIDPDIQYLKTYSNECCLL